MDIVKNIKIKCIEAGTTLPKICEKAGVPYQSVRYWTVKKPKSFEMLEKLEKAINEIKAEKIIEIGVLPRPKIYPLNLENNEKDGGIK